jgi:hypothetical protein
MQWQIRKWFVLTIEIVYRKSRSKHVGVTKQIIDLIIIDYITPIVIIVILLGTLSILFITSKRIQGRLLTVFRIQVSTSTSTIILSSKTSKRKANKLVVLPAIWNEINWTNRSNWSLWLRQGFASQSYHVHLYQRIASNSTAPNDWPYFVNVHNLLNIPVPEPKTSTASMSFVSFLVI